MPEGDTIFRAAATLQRALAGAVVTRFETQLPALDRVDVDTPIAGRTIEFVRPTGKWMEIGFSGGLVLLTHMLMSGSWHIYRPGERWRKSRFHMRIVIETERIVAVAFDVQIAEFHSNKTLARRRGFNALGADVLGADFDPADAATRLAAHPDLEVGVALLNQSILAGIGNVFKSEICFVARVNPFQRIESLSRLQLEDLAAVAARLMKANVGSRSGHERRTTDSSNLEENLWVYQRNGEPCRKCGTIIQSRKQGFEARTSFWCPLCQPATPQRGHYAAARKQNKWRVR